MAVHANRRVRVRKHLEIPCQILARREICEPPARLHNSRGARKMALLADGIPASWRQLRGIHQPGMLCRISVTAFAADATDEVRTHQSVDFGDCSRTAMAKQTFRGDWPREVGSLVRFITRRHIPRAAIRVISNRRLVHMALLLMNIGAPHAPRPHEIAQAEPRDRRRNRGQTLIGEDYGLFVDQNPILPGRMRDDAWRLIHRLDNARGSAHGRRKPPVHDVPMTGCADQCRQYEKHLFVNL